jgi:hypothetical protein
MNWKYYGDSNGDLLVVDTNTEQLIWRGYLEGRQVKKVSQLPGTAGCIVLVVRQVRSKPDPNLWRYSYDKGIIWRAVLPRSGADSYVDFKLEDGDLYANSWSCYRVKIDLDTGQIISRVFT